MEVREGVFVSVENERDGFQIVIGKHGWRPLYINRQGYTPMQAISLIEYILTLNEVEYRLKWEQNYWQLERKDKILGIYVSKPSPCEGYGYFFCNEKPVYFAIAKEGIKSYWINKQGVHILQPFGKNQYKVDFGDGIDYIFKFNGISYSETSKNGIQFYTCDLNRSMSGYFKNRETDHVIFVHLGKSEDWKPYWFDENGPLEMIKVSPYQWKLKKSVLEWSGNSWKVIGEFGDNYYIKTNIENVYEDYFTDNQREIHVLIGLNSWKSYIIGTDKCTGLSLISNHKYQILQDLDQYLEWNGKDRWNLIHDEITLTEFVNPILQSRNLEIMSENHPKVFIIGIGGPSASGKSTLARQIAQDLNSPFQVIQGDAFFKKMIPKHEIYGNNWEIPEAIDWDGFKSVILTLREHLLQNPFKEYPDVINTQRRSNIPINSTTFIKDPNAKVLIIVVESFLMFVKEEMSKIVDIPIFIDCEQNSCRNRRMARDHCSQKWFDNMVWFHFEEFKHLQIKNGNPKIFDGEMDKMALSVTVRDFLIERIRTCF